MATVKESRVLFENGESTVITTNADCNMITIVPHGIGVCQLQVKGVEGAKWVDVAVYDGVSKYQVNIDSEDRIWQGSISNTFAFRINPETCTFDKVECRLI